MSLPSVALLPNRSSRRVRIGMDSFIIAALLVISYAQAQSTSMTSLNSQENTSSTEIPRTFQTVTGTPITVTSTTSTSCMFPARLLLMNSFSIDNIHIVHIHCNERSDYYVFVFNYWVYSRGANGRWWKLWEVKSSKNHRDNIGCSGSSWNLQLRERYV